MTLVEVVVASVLLGFGLLLLVNWTRQAREAAKTRLAVRVLAEMDRALREYHASEKCFPPTVAHDPAPVIKALLEHPQAGARLRGLITSALWLPTTPDTPVDPWGVAWRYVDDAGDDIVRANLGRPTFVSAGPDRDFGDLHRPSLADNLRSDDPTEIGFREPGG